MGRLSFFIATLLLLLAGPTGRAMAQPKSGAAPSGLCAGCVYIPAPRPGPAPLVVLLHGDHERAATRAGYWRRPLQERGFALLSLACPTALGCQDSYWRWDGDPHWIDEQIELVAKSGSVDLHRIWLIGWSGGASYMGGRVQELSRFAALVFHGGGMDPRHAGCMERPIPALFLVGDKNPLHYLARSLRDTLRSCRHEVAWELLPGADHAGELQALGDAKKVRKILDWLEAHVTKSD